MTQLVAYVPSCYDNGVSVLNAAMWCMIPARMYG